MSTNSTHRPLVIYLLLVTIISATFIGLMKYLGVKGYFLASFYMVGPAIAAVITRLFFYKDRFKDANLRIGRPKYYLYFWAVGLGITALSYLLYTLFGAVSWDFSGQTFLDQLAGQMTLAGQDISNLPAGITPQMMLFFYFIGGLTLFNIIPGVISGFGEEFGWRGFMFPLLYKVKPWAAFVVGGLIWYAWHVPLVLVFPATAAFTTWETVLNIFILAIGSLCTFTFLAYVYVKTGSIIVVSFAHGVVNNSARAFSYFVMVNSQFLANLGLTLAMLIVIGILFYSKQHQVFKKLTSETEI